MVWSPKTKAKRNLLNNFIWQKRTFDRHRTARAKSSLNIFAQKYLRKFEDTTYFILQNKYLHIYEDIFGAKIAPLICHIFWKPKSTYVYIFFFRFSFCARICIQVLVRNEKRKKVVGIRYSILPLHDHIIFCFTGR